MKPEPWDDWRGRYRVSMDVVAPVSHLCHDIIQATTAPFCGTGTTLRVLIVNIESQR
jgi:hypothetical protein